MLSDTRVAPVHTVVFDLFGTLVSYRVRRYPYRKLISWGRAAGADLSHLSPRELMAVDLNIEEIAAAAELALTPSQSQQLQCDLNAELDGLYLFDDVIPTLQSLQAQGIGIAICSNLAKPYGAAVKRLLSSFNLPCFFSYELDSLKPEAQIYQAIVERLGGDAGGYLFCGDTFAADFIGPRKMAMQACHLLREGVTEPALIDTEGVEFIAARDRISRLSELLLRV